LTFEARTHLLCFIDLRRAIDGLGNTVPDSRKSSTERGFKLSELVVKSLVAWREKSGDLSDAEEGVGVEDEGDEELTSEFRIVERCASGVVGLQL